MWKNSKKIKKVTMKFDTYTLKEMEENLTTLNDLEVIDWKITSPSDFSIGFNRKFIDYYNLHHDRLQVASIQNMIGALRQYPQEEKPDPGAFVTMFYSTVLLSYLNETGHIRKLDPNNIDLLGKLVITVEELREMMVEEGTKRV